jgi:cell division protein FtsI (penicillin-binding protein 3)
MTFIQKNKKPIVETVERKPHSIKKQPFKISRWRELSVLTVCFFVAAILVARAGVLQIVEKDYLQSQGDARYQRVKEQPPQRGMIVDRFSNPLAISTPVDSVWGHPETLLSQSEKYSYKQLLQFLSMTKKDFMALLKRNEKRQFVYLRRHMKPHEAERILALEVPGIHASREYRRYYPTSPDASHLLGFTNIDNQGQEGVELIANKRLQGSAGKERVMQNRFGQVIEKLEQLKSVEHGETVRLSIDSRIQHLADQYLSAAVKQHKAKSASLVALDAKTGEILALSNVPYFNPNDRADLLSKKFKNRAITDVFEPGSTMKPFAIAMAIDEGVVEAETIISTNGFFNIGRSRISDTKNHGDITVSEVIVKSSNIGSAKIAMKLPAKKLAYTLQNLGFGKKTDLTLRGQQSGLLPKRKKWRPVEHATLSYGYGLSATILQLAQSYTVFTNKGKVLPVTLWAREDGFEPETERVFSEKTVLEVNEMLRQVVMRGTAKQARLPRHSSAGKTGTVHLVSPTGGYQEDHYASVFAGFAPVDDPDIVIAIVVTDPRGEVYYGGQVAGPVFAKVMDGALRYRNIPPDAIEKSIEENSTTTSSRKTGNNVKKEVRG